MAPVTISTDSDRIARLRSIEASARFFQRHLDEFRKGEARYLMIHGENVVGQGATPEEAREDAIGRGHPLDSLCVTFFVPRQGESYFF